MSRPSVAVLIPTYARTALLAEAIESVLRQDYDGLVVAVVLNDCPWQTLRCAHPQVTIVNDLLMHRSLGAKRNSLLQIASKDFITWLDDDDLMLPWYLSQNDDASAGLVPSHWFRTSPGNRWSWEPMPGGIPMILRRELAAQIPFEKRLNVGEDNAWRKAVLERHGARMVQSARPAYVYRTPGSWASISKCTDYRGQCDPQRFLADAAMRRDAGEEPQGSILIEPAWREDYVAKVRTLFPLDRFEGAP